MRWIDIVSGEFEEAVKKSKGVCLLPIGCVELHGHHLPLGNDTMIAAEFSRRAAEKEEAVVFPEMYFGEKAGAGEFPGTIIFPSDLIQKILEHCCLEIARNGFHKILLVNFHGGNVSMLNNFARFMLHQKPNFQIFVYNLPSGKPERLLKNIEKYPYLTEEDIACLTSYVEEGKMDGHGGFGETSAAMACFPQLCKPEKMNELDGTSTRRFAEFDKRKIYTPFAWMGNFPNSLSCSAHEGLSERIIRASGEYSVDTLAEVIRFLKEEKESEAYLKEWLDKQA